ncbi:ATP-binding protein [Massilia sp. S19_KUP03_FR1]|uniref:ATP-binding protein n=1 Tax=Massilia sp. S19_KUP03_FR1 TaxID=3025503 RepID=UPI002FCD748D
MKREYVDPDQASTATLPAPSGDAFRALLLAAAWRVTATLTGRLGEDLVAERFPFLLDYASALESAEQVLHLPLQRLAQAAELSASAVEIWMLNGLIEEDARFGPVYQALDPEDGARRPGMALMQSWWGTLPREGLRPALRALLACGLLRPCQPGATRADSSYEVEDNCWSAVRGEAPAQPVPGVVLRELDAMPALADLTLDDATRATLAALGRLDADAPLAPLHYATVMARGAEHNGRTSVLAALARAEGRRALIIDWPPINAAAEPPWLGAFATLAWARPILRLRASPGERLRLPRLAGYEGWIGIVCGSDDAIDDLPAPSLVLRLPLPDATLRAALIARHGGPALAMHAADVAARLHLSTGFLVSALRTMVVPADAGCGALAAGLREVALAGGAGELDNLARRLGTGGAEREGLVQDAELARDLDTLAARCAQRDHLRATLPGPFAARLNAGVRALFAGPSGTGKTLAAQVLAARLGVPLYRLDLASVVSKYIGETERNLDRVLAAAEALDTMLLLDEGDALLARRTDVGNAHDRYANLETNFLLQRLETHRGLVLVTTNALERIDPAFLRRFDLLVHFHAPELQQRLALWRAHLPPDHTVPDAALARIAESCLLTGGQVRNVVLDTASAALVQSGHVTEALLMAALRREYRRGDALFPLGR